MMNLFPLSVAVVVYYCHLLLSTARGNICSFTYKSDKNITEWNGALA